MYDLPLFTLFTKEMLIATLAFHQKIMVKQEFIFKLNLYSLNLKRLI